MGFLCFVDGHGECRVCIGPECGRKNDIQIWFNSVYADNITALIDDNDNILFDGIYRYVDDHFITPFPGRLEPESVERIYNKLHCGARVIVENYFGLLKQLWPIFGLKYGFRKNRIGIFFRCCIILTNIIIRHQSPLLKQ